MIYFTSDTHFGHTNAIRYCNRPFSSAKEMDEAIIKNWNEIVSDYDTVYHLGDFCLARRHEPWNKYRKRLNGKIHLILGNHDQMPYMNGWLKGFESVSYQEVIYIEGVKVYMNHFPFLCFDGEYKTKRKAPIQLFGHVHSGGLANTGFDIPRLQYLFKRQYDVGVDNNDFKPISFEQILLKLGID